MLLTGCGQSSEAKQSASASTDSDQEFQTSQNSVKQTSSGESGEKKDSKTLLAQWANGDYSVPQGNVDATTLLAFIKKLDSQKLKGTTPQEQTEDYKAQLAAQLQAANKILASNPSEEHHQQAVDAKTRALVVSVQISQASPEVAQGLRNFTAELKKSSIPAFVEAGTEALQWLENYERVAGIVSAARNIFEGTPGAEAKFKAELDRFATTSGMSLQSISTLMEIAQPLEFAGKYGMAKYLFMSMAKALPGDLNEEQVTAVKELAGRATRRLSLVGQKVNFEAVNLDGSPVKLSDYKGKVVLVDFWATWCGPCMQEMPNIRAAYAKYKDRGFEVLGYSMDQDRAAVEATIERADMNWTIMLPENPAERGMENNPYAEKFGLDGIPFVFLVDRSGRVVSMHCRGPRLKEELAKLFDKRKSDSGTSGGGS